MLIGISLKCGKDKLEVETFNFCKNLKEAQNIVKEFIRILMLIIILGATAAIIYFVIPSKKHANLEYYINYTLMEVLVMIEFFYIVPKLLKKLGVARIEDYADLQQL